MEIITVLFTYNRPEHTKKVLDGLLKNSRHPQKLLIFQDGKKTETNDTDWNNVNKLINSVDWCDCEVIVSDVNKGLAMSILDGVKYAFRFCQAVIVLEDDCVPHKNYMQYMEQCLNTYKNNKMVHSVSGYSWPIEIEGERDSDVYACGRVCSYGWGTWKNRWSRFVCDYNMLKEIKSHQDTSLYLAKWGDDLEDMLVSNLLGLIDSWAVFWALNAIGNHQLCINPYESLIENVGFDGTGIHCDMNEMFRTKLSGKKDGIFNIPRQISIENTVEKAFQNLYGCKCPIYDYDEKKDNIVVIGFGNMYKQNERLIWEKYNILAFVDNKKKGYYKGIEIITSKESIKYKNCKFLTMVKKEKTKCEILAGLPFVLKKDQLVEL